MNDEGQNTVESEVEAQFEMLLGLIDEQFESDEFLELVRTATFNTLAEQACAFDDDNESNIPVVLLALLYVYTYRLQDPDGVLGHGGKFTKLRDGLVQDLSSVEISEAMEVFQAMAQYTRVAPEGDILLVDDDGRMFVIVSDTHQILPFDFDEVPPEPIDLELEAGRELLFNAVRGVVKLEYETGLLTGIYSEVAEPAD